MTNGERQTKILATNWRLQNQANTEIYLSGKSVIKVGTATDSLQNEHTMMKKMAKA